MRFCTYILLIALTLQSFYRSIMTMDYQIHLPSYIALCINKDKPLLHCDGQCVLMKKIRENEKKESQKNIVVYEYSALYTHKERIQFTPIPLNVSPKEINHSLYLNHYRFSYEDPIFRPPLV